MPHKGSNSPESWIACQDVEVTEANRERYEECLGIAESLVGREELRSLGQQIQRTGELDRDTRVFFPEELIRAWMSSAVMRHPACFTFCQNITVEAAGWVEGLHRAGEPLPQSPPLRSLTLLLWWLSLNSDPRDLIRSLDAIREKAESVTADSMRRTYARCKHGAVFRTISVERLGKSLLAGSQRGVVHLPGQVDPDLHKTVFAPEEVEAIACEFLARTTRVEGAKGKILVFHGNTVKGQRWVDKLAPLANSDAVLTQAAWEEAAVQRMRWIGRDGLTTAKREFVAHNLHVGESARRTGRLLIEAGLTKADSPENARQIVEQMKSKDLTASCPCPRLTVSKSQFSQ